MTCRDIEAPGALAEVEARAILNWTRREHQFHTRMRWSQGSFGARYSTMYQAAKELGYITA